MRPWGGGGTNWKVQWYKKQVWETLLCAFAICAFGYIMCEYLHLSLLSFEKTFVFEANMCVGSRHQQGLISAQMTDGKRQWEDNRGGELQHYGGNKKSHQIRPGPQTELQKELFLGGSFKENIARVRNCNGITMLVLGMRSFMGSGMGSILVWVTHSGSWGRSWVCSWGRSWSQSWGQSQCWHHFEWHLLTTCNLSTTTCNQVQL